MKSFACIAALFLSFGPLLAQDNIIFLNGKEEKAKVTEVNSQEIKYRISQTEDAALFIVPRSEVFMIQFEDGLSRIITPVERIADDAPSIVEKEKSILVEEKELSYHQMGKRRPGVALLFSMMVPGGGQFYNGDIAKGVVMSSMWGLGGIVSLSALRASNSRDYKIAYCEIDAYGNSDCSYEYQRFSQGQKIALGVGTGTAIGALIWSLIDAPVVAAVRNRKINLKNNDGTASRQLIWNIYPGSAKGAGAAFSLTF